MNYAGGYFPAFMFVLAASFVNEFSSFSPPLTALILLMGAYGTMINSYKHERAAGHWFDAGFLVSTASLIYFPYIGFVVFIVIGFLVVRPVNVREFLMSLVGVVVPIFFISVFYYWTNKLDLLVEHFLDYYAPEALSEARQYLLPVTLRLGALLLLALLSAWAVKNIYYKAVIHHRIIMGLCFVFVLAGIFSTLLMPQNYFAHFIWFSIPFSLLVTWAVTNLRRRWTAEVLHLCLILLLFYFQYFYPASVN